MCIRDRVGYDAPPGTWHELVELCTALRLNYPAVTPLALDPSSGRALLDAMIAGGSAAGTQAVAAYTASGFDFSDPCFIEGLQTFKTVCRVATGTVFGNNYANSISAFNKGMAAILTGDVWAKASISDELNVAFAPFPAYDGKRVACNSVGINYICLLYTSDLGDDADRYRLFDTAHTLAAVYLLPDWLGAKPIVKYHDLQPLPHQYVPARY